MAIVEQLIRSESDDTLSFGNYQLSEKANYCIQSTLYATYFRSFFVKTVLFFPVFLLVFVKTFLLLSF